MEKLNANIVFLSTLLTTLNKGFLHGNPAHDEEKYCDLSPRHCTPGRNAFNLMYLQNIDLLTASLNLFLRSVWEILLTLIAVRKIEQIQVK